MAKLTNEPTVARANVTNEPTVAWVNVTNEPTVAWVNVTNEPTVAWVNVTNEPTVARANVTNEPTDAIETDPATEFPTICDRTCKEFRVGGNCLVESCVSRDPFPRLSLKESPVHSTGVRPWRSTSAGCGGSWRRGSGSPSG